MQLTLHLTSACNYRCRYCYYDAYPTDRLSLTNACRAVEHALATRPDHLGVTLFGGEPLLCKDEIRTLVPSITATCKSAGVPVSFTMPTNGALLDAEFLSFSLLHNVFISLSIDGPERASAERVTADGRPTFGPTENALHLLRDHAPTFGTYSVVTPANARYLSESVQYLYAKGSRIIVVSVDLTADWLRVHLRELSRQYRRIARFYIRETCNGEHFYLSLFDGKIRARTEGIPKHAGCRPGRNRFSVAPDGRYYPCVQFVEQPGTAIGDAHSGFHRTCSEDDSPGDAAAPCGGCGIRTRCSSACACANVLAGGEATQATAVQCEHERLITTWADRVGRALFRRRAPRFIGKHYNPQYDQLRAIEDIIGAENFEDEDHAQTRFTA